VARIIAEAGVRLVADSKGFGASIRSSIRAAMKEASLESEDARPFAALESDAARTASRSGSLFRGLFASLTRGASALGSALTGAVKFALVGAAAGAAAASLSTLLGVLIPVIAAMAQASGVVALLPAALLGVVAVTTTLKLGLQGVGDAFKALASGDVTKFNEALKDLAPAAQEFVKATAKVKPEFDKMQLDVQERLFAGLGAQIGKIATLYLPQARSLFGGLATTINGAGRSLFAFAQSGETVAGVSQLVNNIKLGFQQLLAPITQVTRAFLDLAVVGSGFFPGMAEGIGQAAARFSEFISTAAKTGKLQEFFSKSLSAAGQLGSIFRDLGVAIFNVFSIGNQVGGGFLGTIQQVVAQFRAFTESVSGQNALRSFFESAATAVSNILPLVTSLATAIGTTLAPILANLTDTLGPAILPIFEMLADALRFAAPGIAALGEGVAALLQGIQPLVPIIGRLAGALGGALGEAIAALAPSLSDLAQALGNSLIDILPKVIPPLGDIIAALGEVLTAVVPLLGPLGDLISVGLAPLAGMVRNLVGPIGRLVEALANALAPVIPIIGDALNELGDAMAPFAETLGTVLVQAVEALAPLLPPLVEFFAGLAIALAPIQPALLSTLQPMIQLAGVMANLLIPVLNVLTTIVLPLLTDIIAGFTLAVTTASGIIGGAIGIVSGVISGFVSFLGAVWAMALDIVVSAGAAIVNAVTGAFNIVASVVSNATNTALSTVTGWIASLVSSIRNGFNNAVSAVQGAWRSIVDAVSSGVNNVLSYVRGLPGQILSALGNLSGTLFRAGQDMIAGLVNGLRAAGGQVKSFLLGLIGNAVDSVKAFLGIKSPSTVFAGIGRDMGRGMIVGLEAITPQAVAAADAMARTVTASLADVAGGVTSGITAADVRAITPNQGGATVGSDGIMLHLYQTNNMLPGADVRQFSDVVAQRAAREIAAGGNVLTVQRQPVQDGINDQTINGVRV
jgi:phage-related protein